jgi:LacI family transcriptional regulator
MPSIRDVANKAGVSTATVSHVLNHTRFVSEETQQRVMDAVTDLDYSPSALARGLASNKSLVIGVVFSDIANSHFTSIFKGIESDLTEAGYDLILANTSENPEHQEEVLTALLSRRVDGLILAPTGQPSKRLRSLREKGLPIVLIDRGDPRVALPIVGVDNRQAAYRASSHLLADGHRRIGILLGLEKLSTTRERLNGYVQALSEAGLEADPELIIQGDSSQEGGYQGTWKLLSGENRPTAIFSTNNMMTLGALHALGRRGMRCPEDVGFLGFDDHPWADIFTPPLSVVSQPTRDLGICAARLLRRIIEEGYPTVGPLGQQLDASLIIRGSCSTECRMHYLHAFEQTGENE